MLLRLGLHEIESVASQPATQRPCEQLSTDIMPFPSNDSHLLKVDTGKSSFPARGMFWIGLLVASVVAAVCLYVKHTHSPEYSLSVIGTAYRNHDVEMFEKYVDVESIIARALDKGFDRLPLQEGIQARLYAPQMVAQWKQIIIKAVESDKDEKAFLQSAKVTRDGSVVTIVAELRAEPDVSIPLTFVMRYNSIGYWRLVEVVDADRFIFGPPQQ